MCPLHLRFGNDPHQIKSATEVTYDETIRILESSQILLAEFLDLYQAIGLCSSLQTEQQMFQ